MKQKVVCLVNNKMQSDRSMSKVVYEVYSMKYEQQGGKLDTDWIRLIIDL